MMEAVHTEAAALGREVTTTARTPLRRIADLSETAKLIVFLCSDDAAFCTGASFLADGGVMAGNPLQGESAPIQP